MMFKLSRRIKLVSYFSFIIANSIASPKIIPIYIGSYTINANPSGNGAGIYRVELDLDNGGIIPSLFLAANTINSSYILISKNILYTVNEIDNFENKTSGSVSAFNIKPNGDLALINCVSSIGANPVSLATDKGQHNLIVADYGNGSFGSAGVVVLPLMSSGALKYASQMIEYSGNGLDHERQSAPHTHNVSSTWLNGHQFVFSVDLGLDRIFTYTLDSNSGILTQNAETTIVDKANRLVPIGPRHITLSQNKHYMYLVNELSSDIYVYKLNLYSGNLKFIQKIKSYNGKSMRNYPAEIMLNSVGRYLYVSNRGRNTIAQFSVNAKNGKLNYITEFSTYGDFPRDFDIDASGKYLVVANQKSDNVTLFNIDLNNGALNNAQTFNVPTPVTVKFAN